MLRSFTIRWEATSIPEIVEPILQDKLHYYDNGEFVCREALKIFLLVHDSNKTLLPSHINKHFIKSVQVCTLSQICS